MSKHRHLSKVRHFGMTMDGDVIATHERGHGDVEVCGSGLSAEIPLEEFRRRCKASCDRHDPFVELLAHRPVFIDDERVSKDDIECVYNDWICVNNDLGAGTYERFANFYELKVLEMALELYSQQASKVYA